MTNILKYNKASETKRSRAQEFNPAHLYQNPTYGTNTTVAVASDINTGKKHGLWLSGTINFFLIIQQNNNGAAYTGNNIILHPQ